MTGMRRILKAISATGVTIGASLFLAHVILEWWSWHAFLETLGPDGFGRPLVDPPPPGPAEAAVRYVLGLVALCLFGALLAASVVWPVTNVARRVFRQPLAGRLTAVSVIAVLSSLGFAGQTSPSGPWHPAVVFAIGGAIGIAAATIFTLMMPPNTSLERTREE